MSTFHLFPVEEFFQVAAIVFSVVGQLPVDAQLAPAALQQHARLGLHRCLVDLACQDGRIVKLHAAEELDEAHVTLAARDARVWFVSFVLPSVLVQPRPRAEALEKKWIKLSQCL